LVEDIKEYFGTVVDDDDELLLLVAVLFASELFAPLEAGVILRRFLAGVEDVEERLRLDIV
jgi:hypothetical protein